MSIYCCGACKVETQMIRKSIFGLMCVFAIGSTAVADVVNVPASIDNTLYDDGFGDLSNGAGDHMFVGINGNGMRRRAVVRFDVAGSVPAGAVINSASLTLSMSQTTSGPQTQSIHRLFSDWGEAGSHAPGNEGGGAFAQPGDATWLHMFSNTSLWSTEGGDFDATASDSLVINGPASYSWSGPQVIADVQDMFYMPASNYGWLIMGAETGVDTAKRYDTKDNTNTVVHPVLVIDFTVPCVLTADINNDGVVDTADLGILIGEFGLSCP